LKSASHQYANALADIALRQGAADPVLKQLSEIGAAYQESPELRNFFSSPAVPREAKHGVAEKLVARIGASRILRNFLFVIIDHRRTQAIPEIAQAFQEVIQQRQGLAQAEVLSATPLNEPQKAKLLEALERLSGKKIQPTYALQSDLLGGAVVRIGDTIYDGSLKNRLNQMRQHLAAE
jgi:F-type H+-transporting ATPase subunit delta